MRAALDGSLHGTLLAAAAWPAKRAARWPRHRALGAASLAGAATVVERAAVAST
jgi:hypothetical protein